MRIGILSIVFILEGCTLWTMVESMVSETEKTATSYLQCEKKLIIRTRELAECQRDDCPLDKKKELQKQIQNLKACVKQGIEKAKSLKRIIQKKTAQ